MVVHHRIRISGLVVEYVVAIDVTRARFPADAYAPNACRCLLAVRARDVMSARVRYHFHGGSQRCVGGPTDNSLARAVDGKFESRWCQSRVGGWPKSESARGAVRVGLELPHDFSHDSHHDCDL